MVIGKLSVSLPVELVEEVKAAVADGRYASASEVVRDALRDWLLTSSAVIMKRPPRVPPSTSDLLPSQLAELEISAQFRGIHRFAIRGSARKRVIEAAVTFRPPLPYRWTPEEAREDTEWTIVYDAGFCGSETESSSTS